MSPFSESLERFRRRRGLNQSQLARRLGIASSYISILERGHKPPPSSKLLQKIISTLKLDKEETNQLLHDAKISSFYLKVPQHASREEFELIYKMGNQVGSYSPSMLAALRALTDLHVPVDLDIERKNV